MFVEHDRDAGGAGAVGDLNGQRLEVDQRLEVVGERGAAGRRERDGASRRIDGEPVAAVAGGDRIAQRAGACCRDRAERGTRGAVLAVVEVVRGVAAAIGGIGVGEHRRGDRWIKRNMVVDDAVRRGGSAGSHGKIEQQIIGGRLSTGRRRCLALDRFQTATKAGREGAAWRDGRAWCGGKPCRCDHPNLICPR